MTLKELRKAKGLTQEELATISGSKQSIYSRYESGEIRLPVETAKKIAPVLSVKWWELYPDKETEEGNE